MQYSNNSSLLCSMTLYFPIFEILWSPHQLILHFRVWIPSIDALHGRSCVLYGRIQTDYSSTTCLQRRKDLHPPDSSHLGRYLLCSFEISTASIGVPSYIHIFSDGHCTKDMTSLLGLLQPSTFPHCRRIVLKDDGNSPSSSRTGRRLLSLRCAAQWRTSIVLSRCLFHGLAIASYLIKSMKYAVIRN